MLSSTCHASVSTSLGFTSRGCTGSSTQRDAQASRLGIPDHHSNKVYHTNESIDALAYHRD